MGFFDDDETDDATGDDSFLGSISGAVSKAWDVATAPAVAAGEAVADAARAAADFVYSEDDRGLGAMNTPWLLTRSTYDGETQHNDLVLPGTGMRAHGDVTHDTADVVVGIGPVDLIEMKTHKGADGQDETDWTILPQVGQAKAWIDDTAKHNHLHLGSDIGEAAAGLAPHEPTIDLAAEYVGEAIDIGEIDADMDMDTGAVDGSFASDDLTHSLPDYTDGLPVEVTDTSTTDPYSPSDDTGIPNDFDPTID